MLQTTKNLNSSYEKLGDTKLGTKIWENTDGRTTLALASRRPLRKAAGASAVYIKVSHFPAHAWKWLDLF